MAKGDFLVWCPELGQTKDEARRFAPSSEAYDAESAARLWAQVYDQNSAEYSIVSGQPLEVVAMKEGHDPKEGVLFVVSGRSVPHYSARPVPASTHQPGRPRG